MALRQKWNHSETTRLVISLGPKQKLFLENLAKRQRISLAEAIRRLIDAARASEEAELAKLLQQLSGAWEQGDGLEYQERIRGEWDR